MRPSIFCLLVILSVVQISLQEVQLFGPTEGPNFVVLSIWTSWSWLSCVLYLLVSKGIFFLVSATCPSTHPYTVNNHQHCCSQKFSQVNGISAFCDGSFLNPEAPTDCCAGLLAPCPGKACKPFPICRVKLT